MATEIYNTSNSQPEIWDSMNARLKCTMFDLFVGWSTWQYVVAFVLAVVIYDQSIQSQWKVFSQADTVFSNIYQAKGCHCWPSIQDSTRGPVHSGNSSKVRSVSCPVGEWPSKLCVCLPQVSHVSGTCKYWINCSRIMQICRSCLRPRPSP